MVTHNQEIALKGLIRKIDSSHLSQTVKDSAIICLGRMLDGTDDEVVFFGDEGNTIQPLGDLFSWSSTYLGHTFWMNIDCTI